MVRVLKQWWEQSTETRRGRLSIVGGCALLIIAVTFLNYTTWAYGMGWSGIFPAAIIAICMLFGIGLLITLIILIVNWVRGKESS